MNSQDFAKLLLRLTCGGILLFHGVHKVFVEIDHIKDILRNIGLPDVLAYGNIVGEFVAPIFILIGFKTRLAALVVAVNMLFSILLAHSDIIFSVNDYGGWMIETNMLFMMTAITLVFTGAGKYSLLQGREKWG